MPGESGGIPLRCSAVICAYNEEQNLPGLLDALLRARAPWFDLEEIVVVASGCTDSTVRLLEARSAREARLRVVVQPTREGKASALALGIRSASSPILLIENADTVPAAGAVAALLRPLLDPGVALVACRPQPVNTSASVTARIGGVLWDVHDALSRLHPKVGEAFAIRRGQALLPSDVEDDDTFLGAYATLRGGRSVYASDAIVYNRVPTRLGELIGQRLRINRQIARLARRTGILSIAWEPGALARALIPYLRAHPGEWPECLALGGIELLCRAGALLDSRVGRTRIAHWRPAASTKLPIDLQHEPRAVG